MRRAVRRCPTSRTATTDGSGGTVRGPAAGSAAVRPQRRGGRGGPTPTAPHVRPAGTVSAGVCAPTGQPVRSPDTTADASAAAPPLQLAVVRHGSGHRPAMLTGARTPAVRSAAADRSRPLAERPAAMPVESAAEGPQRFRPGGSNGTGCRTPDRSRAASCLDTPSADMTTWPHRTGRRKQRTVNPLITSARYNLLYFSSRPALRAGLRPPSGPATTRRSAWYRLTLHTRRYAALAVCHLYGIKTRRHRTVTVSHDRPGSLP